MNIVQSSISYCMNLRMQYDILQGPKNYNVICGARISASIPFDSINIFLQTFIVYSYLMGVDAIDQTIYPSVLGMTKCSIA